MIEVILKNYLSDALAFPVLMEKPDNPPAEFALLERTGDGEENCIRDATIAIQTYAGSLYRAAEMAETVAETMENAVVVDDIASIELNSIYNFTDRLTKEYRYQAVFNVIYYGGQ